MSESKHTIYGSRVEREIEHLRKMQSYYAFFLTDFTGFHTVAGNTHRVYLASEVDARIAELEGLLHDLLKPRIVTHIPDSSGLTLPQLVAGKQALYSCSEDPSFDDVRRVIAAVAQSNPTAQGKRDVE